METQEYRVSSIFIVPLIVFFVGVLLFIALLYGQRDLTVFAILILGVVTGARLWSRYGLSGIRCYSAVDRDKVFPGERLSLTVRAENAKFLPIWLQMTVPVAGPLHPGSEEAAFTEESGLLWYQKARFEWDLVAQRRGVHRVGPPYIKAADIFGFFPRQREEHESLHVMVYPRLVPLRSISLPRRDLFGVPGSKSPVQDPVYILGTRDYQQWRPARYIHWKASARHNRLQEKIFEPSEQEKVLLAVEVSLFSENSAEEDFENTLEVVASLAVRLDQRGFAVGLVTNGAVDGGGPTIVPIARNPGQLPAILEALARLRMEAKWDLIAMLRDTFELSWGVSCVHFSYEEDVKTQHTEGYLLQRKVPTVRVVCRSGPASGAYKRTGRGKVYRLDEIRIGKAEGQMKAKRGVLLLLANGGMELSWLYALVNFITIAMIHRPFPLPEALGTFALAAALTLIARGSGWRVILILGIQVAGFVCAASRIVYVFDSWSFPFLSQGWIIEFFGRPRGFVEWFIFSVLLLFALSFWMGGLTLARRSGAYLKICARFDLGVAAFAGLFLVKFLFLVKGNMDIHDRAAEALLFPFFLFSLLAIGMARNRSMARRDFLSGYQGIGIFLSFTVVVLVFGAGLVLLFLPYLTMAAEFGYGILKTTARPLGPILVSIIRFLFMHGQLRPETRSQSGGGEEVDIVSSTETSWWMELLEKVLGWGFMGLAALVGIIVCCLGAWYLLRWLFSRTSRSEEKHIQWNLIFLWASRLWAGLIVLWHKLVARLKGFKDAAQLYSALLRWGRHSGLPRSLSETPAEYGGRLERQFPPLRRNIEVIVDAYNEQVYGEMVLDESQLTTAKHSWRSLRSPYYWPSRFKSWFLRSGEY